MVQDFSFWEYEAYHTLWDVCIIGSGINGISAGISILERAPGIKVLIVDRWFIPLGASTRNAGFSCFGSPSEILSDISLMGEAEAIKLVDQRWRGLQKLQTRLSNSNARYENFGGYELFEDEEFENISSRLDYLNELIESVSGLTTVFNLVNVPDGIRGFSKVVFNKYEGQLHPVKMMEHLKQTYLSLGGKIWTGLSVEEIVEKEDYIQLCNKFAFPIEAKKVIVTTNAFVHNLIPDLDVQGARNHVLVTQQIEKLKWKGCFHYDKGFYYFRNIGNRILLGGARNKDFESENTDQFGNNQIILDALHEFLFDHLADKDIKIEYQWSGIIAVGSEKQPIIRSISPRLFVGVRCSGMGIALASLIGEKLADMVCNSEPESFVY